MIGSKDEKLKERIIKSNLLLDFFEKKKKKVLKITNKLIDGEKYEKSPQGTTFAIWLLIDTLAISRPKLPLIPYPFIDLYDFIDVLKKKKKKKYPNLIKIFEAINGKNTDFELPISVKEWAILPTITFIEQINEKTAYEAKKMKEDFENEAKWTFDFDDEPNDILQVLDWFLEANEKNKSICLVMDGDL
ncbi:hypothetical protein AD998_17435 [bacterium 336/3]|nr:hypothetical protein AD998_17435 [bacterium 336/3]